MKKICYVVTIPLTVRSFLIPQLKYLASNGFDVSVICTDDGKVKGELGDTVKYIPVDIPRGFSVTGSIRAIMALKKIFKREKYDLIQYSTPNAALYASIAAKLVGCKVRNYHLMGFRYLGASGIGRGILETIEKITCENSTSIECVSKSNMEVGIKEGLFKPEKVTVVWNGSTGGVDITRFDYNKRSMWRSEIRNKLGFCEGDFIYGFVGRITRDKGINELLKAFQSLNDNSRLLLVGPMEGMDTLDPELLGNTKKNPDIVFHNVVSDIEKYYAAIDVLMLPSYREGFGNVVIEAAAVGTPAIVSNIPGPIDSIDEGKTALKVEAKNVEDLREKMLQIRTLDCRVMGQQAAKYSKEKFDSDILCKKIADRKSKLLVP